jgi:hypothetical protein
MERARAKAILHKFFPPEFMGTPIAQKLVVAIDEAIAEAVSEACYFHEWTRTSQTSDEDECENCGIRRQRK